jgi:RNA polymerase sigma-70 factor (ECF subfamily)
LDTRDLSHLLEAILRKMPEKLRIVFVMFELDEVRGEEIARVLQVPVGTVRSRLRLARAAFQREVKRFSEFSVECHGGRHFRSKNGGAADDGSGSPAFEVRASVGPSCTGAVRLSGHLPRWRRSAGVGSSSRPSPERWEARRLPR